MKTIIYLFLLSLASASCDSEKAVDNGRENYITPPEYSKINQQVYNTHVTPATTKTPKYTVPPLPKLPPLIYKELPPSTYVPPTKPYSTPKPIKAPPPPPVTHKPAPLVKKLIEEPLPISYDTQIYNVPKSIVETYSIPAEYEDKDTTADNKDNADLQDGPVQYQYQEEYPPLSTGPTYDPPVAIYNHIYQPLVRRRLFTPAYNPVYPSYYNVVPQAYRSLGYRNPFAFTVPSITYGYSSQSTAGGFNYESPSLAYDNGIRYTGFINAGYDDFLKRKK